MADRTILVDDLRVRAVGHNASGGDAAAAHSARGRHSQKVKSPLNVLYKMTKALTFEKFPGHSHEECSNTGRKRVGLFRGRPSRNCYLCPL